MVSTSENELKMDPNQDKELKNLSNKTEELLSRLNELSDNLSSQLTGASVPNASVSIVPTNPKTEDEPEFQAPNFQDANEQVKANYYKIPVNTHYLEKHEKRVQTSGSGENFVTTSSTSFFREQRFHGSKPSNDSQNQESDFITANFNDFDFNPDTTNEPVLDNVDNFKPQQKVQNEEETITDSNDFSSKVSEQFSQPQELEVHSQAKQNINQAPPKEEFKAQATKNIESEPLMDKSLKDAISDAKTKVISSRHPRFKISKSFEKEDTEANQKEDWINSFTNKQEPEDDSLEPAVVFSSDEQQTKRSQQSFKPNNFQHKSVEQNFTEIDARTKEIADELAAKNKEIKDRLNKYSKRVNVSSQVDNLKLFAWLVLLFSPAIPIAVIKDDFILALGCSSLALFFGIFFSMMALRLVEISELVRWAHNQILHIQTSVDELEEKNKSVVE